MVCVGIDVAKDKHDCFILSSEGEVLADVFTVANNRDGFETLFQRIRACARPTDNIKVGLKATGAYAHMEKRGSRYLRYALFNAAKYVCHWEPSFAAYLAKKRAEGKHYNVAISHAVKKLVRLIFALQTSGRAFQPA